MMAAVTFGDLLFTGVGHLETASGRWDQEAGDPLAAGRQLYRVVDVMTRYVDGVAPWDYAGALGRADLVLWQRAGTHIAQSLHRAAQALGRGLEGLEGLQAGPELPLGLPLAEAATALLAGRDLLNTHLATGPDGARVERTEWAQVITSAPVTRAVTDMIAWWCQQLAPLAEQLSRPGHGLAAGAAPEFAAAGQWLRQATAFARPARLADPVSVSDRTLLFAIPPAAMSAWERPRAAETAADLCGGITRSASRLQAAARGAAQRAAWSPAETAGAWRWTATAGAVTSHLTEAVLRSLAARAGPLGLPEGELHAAAAALAASQASWHQVTAAWGLITTETRFLATPAVTEASDLIVRLGRLACDDPAWTPAAAHHAPLRDPAVLAPDAAAAAAIVAAAHYAACAFERVAAADLGAVEAARQALRLYVPTRIIPDARRRKNDWRTIPRAYVIAPEEQTAALIEAYRAAVTASGQAAQALDQAALAAGAPSRAMALAREAFRAEERLSHLPPPADDLAAPNPWAGGPGPAEGELVRLRVTDPLVLQRAAAIDAAGQNLITEARTSVGGQAPGPVDSELARLGVTDPVMLQRAAAIDAAGRKLILEARTAAAGGPPPGPAESELARLGVTDPVMLQRAAVIDAAGQKLTAEARAAADRGPAAPVPALPAGRVRGPARRQDGPTRIFPAARPRAGRGAGLPGAAAGRRGPRAGRDRRCYDPGEAAACPAGPGRGIPLTRPARTGGAGGVSPAAGRNRRTARRSCRRR